MSKRPGGVTVFAVLGVVFGAVGLLGNGVLLLGALMLGGVGQEATTAMGITTLQQVFALGLLALSSGLLLAAGIGLFWLKPWVRLGYVVAVGVNVATRLVFFPLHFLSPVAPTGTSTQEVVQQAGQRAGAVIGDLGAIAFNLVALWYFHRAAIKALFLTPPVPPTTGTRVSSAEGAG